MLYDGTAPTDSSLPSFSSSLHPQPTRTAYFKSLIEHAKKYPFTAEKDKSREIKEWYRDRVGKNSGKETFLRFEGKCWSEDITLVGSDGGNVKEEQVAEVKDPRKKDELQLVVQQKHPVGRVVRKEFYDVQYEV